jgi:hypothetical protein
LDKDVALVDEILRCQGSYGRYQNIQDPTSWPPPNSWPKCCSSIHYNARAALIRAVWAAPEAEARQMVATVPGLPADMIRKIDVIARKQSATKRSLATGRAARHRLRTARIPPHRQPAARPRRPPGRPRLVALFPLAGR